MSGYWKILPDLMICDMVGKVAADARIPEDPV
jgi:hypothetical protein